MEAAKTSWVSVEDYLREERRSEVRHEYVAGAVYATAGASEEHNTIAANLLTAIHSHLPGKPCKVFILDLKVGLALGADNVFYYPDLMVACDSRDTDRYSKRFPKVLVEILSPETERIDRGEKFLAYTNIETLEEYVLVSQDRINVTVFRRASHWAPAVLTEKGQQLALESINFSMNVEAIYEGVTVS